VENIREYKKKGAEDARESEERQKSRWFDPAAGGRVS
jgi:hypothetical protein